LSDFWTYLHVFILRYAVLFSQLIVEPLVSCVYSLMCSYCVRLTTDSIVFAITQLMY